jgi:hypothetical protein
MGSHVGWHIAVCCPLRGGRGEFRKKTPKTIRKNKYFLKHGGIRPFTEQRQ